MKKTLLFMAVLASLFWGSVAKASCPSFVYIQGAWPAGQPAMYPVGNPMQTYSGVPFGGYGAQISVAVQLDPAILNLSNMPASLQTSDISFLNSAILHFRSPSMVVASAGNPISQTAIYTYGAGYFVNLSFNVPASNGMFVSGTPYTLELAQSSCALSYHNTAYEYYMYNDFNPKPSLYNGMPQPCAGTSDLIEERWKFFVQQGQWVYPPLEIGFPDAGWYECTWISSGGSVVHTYKYIPSSNYVTILPPFTTSASALNDAGWTLNTSYTNSFNPFVMSNELITVQVNLLYPTGNNPGTVFQTQFQYNMTLPTLTPSSSNICSGSSFTLDAEICDQWMTPFNRAFLWSFNPPLPFLITYTFELSSDGGLSWNTVHTANNITTTSYAYQISSLGLTPGQYKYRVSIHDNNPVVSHPITTPPWIVYQYVPSADVTSAVTDITILPPPANTYYFGGTGGATNADFYMCPQSNFTVNISNGTTAYGSIPTGQTIQWEKWNYSSSAWEEINSAVNASYNIPQAELFDPGSNNKIGQYRYKITETATGCTKYCDNIAVVRQINSLAILSAAQGGTTSLSNGVNSIPLEIDELTSNLISASYPWTSYQWYRNGTLVATTSTYSNYVATLPGKYKLVVSGNCGYQESNEISVTGDCNQIPSMSNTTVTIPGSFNFASFIFDGEIILSGSAAVVDITGITVQMTPNTRIIIENGASLTIDNAVISGSCAGWGGIIVRDGTLNIINGSTISDAQAAVYIDQTYNGTVLIDGNTFSNNHISVYSQGPLTGGSFTVTNNIFQNMALCQLDNILNNSTIDNNHAYVFIHSSTQSTGDFYISDNGFSGIVNHIPSVQSSLLIGKDANRMRIFQNSFDNHTNGIKIHSENYDNTIQLNTFNNISNYGITADPETAAAADNKLLIRENTFDQNVVKGILLTKINGFKIKLNTFNGGPTGSNIERGIECYNDDYTVHSNWDPNMIAGNIFHYVEKGLTIAPLHDVYLQGPGYDLSSNYGSVQNIAILCNEFDHNQIGISGTGMLADQTLNHTDPGNRFTGNTLWDILWFHLTSNNASSSFVYFSNSSAGQHRINDPALLSLPQTSFNNFSNTSPLVSGFFNHRHRSNNFYDCGLTANDETHDYETMAESPTGIMETHDMGALSIYPNPATASFRVSFKNELRSVGKVVVCDLLGKPVFTQTISPKNMDIDIDCLTWAKGVYIIKIYDGNELRTSQKLIKIH